MKQGICTNFGNCTKADDPDRLKHPLQIPEGADLVCPQCGASLTPIGKGPLNVLLPALLIFAFLIVCGIGVGAWYLLKPKPASVAAAIPTATPSPLLRESPPPLAAITPSPFVAPAPEPTPTALPISVSLNIHGSNTIGSKLMASLLDAFLAQEGWSNITRVPGKNPDEYSIQGVVSGTSAVQSVQVEAHGSATAFDSLTKATCDIGMSSRKIKPPEQAMLAALGDMTSPACEHVLALDGIAIVVNKANPIASLSRKQIQAIFSGQTTDWAQVGGSPGHINLFARDDRSGTYDSFKSLVLESASLAPATKRFEDSNALSDDVAADPDGIGFVGLPFIRSTRALPVSDQNTIPLLPSVFTVAREDYVFSRRLFLYTPAKPPNPVTLRFIQFATSDAGQEIVAREGFVNQIVKKEIPKLAGPDGSLPPEYARLTANAERLSVDFRFRTGSSQLDNKAVDDLDRVTTYLASPTARGKEVMLLGFADNKGNPQTNNGLSNERAKIVDRQFGSRGVLAAVCTGFGSAVPVASNETDEGRDKNRRVEVWLK
jgi:phosphate transport system substrate-binding protein